MRARIVCLLGAVVLASCGDAGLPEPLPPSVTVEPASGASTGALKTPANNAETAVSASSGVASSAAPTLDPPLKPLPRDDRRPCDVAKARRDRARELLSAGVLYRALRELDAADRACAADAARGFQSRLEALVKLGKYDDARALAKQVLEAEGADAGAKKAARDVTSAPAPAATSGASILANAEAAKARGDAASARALYDQALARLEQESSSKASLLWARELDTPLALSADGSTAVLVRGKTAVLVDAARLAPLRFFDSEHAIVGAALSRDGRLIATVDAEGGVCIWSTATGKKQRQIAWAGERATEVAFTSDGKRLVVMSGEAFDTSMRVWNAETGDSIAAWKGERSGEPKSFAVSRDDKFLAVGTERGNLTLWTLAPKPKVAFVLSNRESFIESVISIAFSPKGDRLAAVFESGSAGVWDTSNGKQVWISASPGAFQRPGACAFSADGTRLLAGWSESRAGGTVRVWDAAGGAELQNKPGPGRVVAFSDDAKRGIAGGEDGRSVTLIDIADMDAIASRTTGLSSATEAVFGPPRVIALGFDREESLRVLLPAGLRTLALGESTRLVAPSFDGKTLATSIHGEVTLWDLESGRARERVPRIDFYPRSIALAPDGSVLATDAFTSVVLVNSGPSRGAFRKVFSKTRGDVPFPTFTLARFGRRAIAVIGAEVGVVDALSGQVLVVDHGVSKVGEAALSPDGKIAMLINDERLTRFDAATGASLGPAAALACGGDEISISFDGSRVASRCGDNVRVLTFTAGGAPAAVNDIQCGPGARVAEVSPHGDLLVCAHNDGIVRIQRVDDGRLVAKIRFLAGKDAALLEAEDGRVELLGASAAEIEKDLVCRVGAVAYPFDVCSGALAEPGLIAEVLAPR